MHFCEDTDIEKNYIPEVLFSIKGPASAISIDWLEKEGILAAGFEDGWVCVFNYNPSSDPNVKALPNLIAQNKVHSSRVLCVKINPEKKLVYSIHKGTRLRVLDYGTNQVVNETLISSEQTHLTHLEITSDFKYAIIGDMSGKIFVYYLLTTPPLYAKAFQAAQSKLYSFSLDSDTRTIYSAGYEEERLQISVFKEKEEDDIELEGIRELRCIRHTRMIRIWKERNELYLGHDKGVVSVFSLSLSMDGPTRRRFS